MAEKDEQQRDWTHLPGELLDTIMRRMTKLRDIVRFQAVCKPWRLAVLDQEQNPPKFLQSLPWQMHSCKYFPTSAGNSCSGSDGCHRFLDVVENDNCILHVDLGTKKHCNGSAYGWLIMQEQYCRPLVLYLLNPLTGNKITLANKIAGRERERGDQYLDCVSGNNLNGFAMSAEPTAAEGCVVVAAYHEFGGSGLVFWKLGGTGERETELQQICTFIPIDSLVDHPQTFLRWDATPIEFWRDKVHIFCGEDGDGRVLSCDLAAAAHPLFSWAFVPEDFTLPFHGAGGYCVHFLVASPEGGELMLLSRHKAAYTDEDRTCRLSFFVHRMNEDGKRWDEAKTIGDYAIFMVLDSAFLVSVKDHPECRRDSVYYEGGIYDLNGDPIPIGPYGSSPPHCRALLLPCNY
ncbi:unnamed protein product [Linum trigynum]|uniref:KIB1-4 beta-propeller domain-containing protein n=1 Tax=Linum trigynum TaxID=586398 RepID=A0AAV2C7V3_9ROSI